MKGGNCLVLYVDISTFRVVKVFSNSCFSFAKMNTNRFPDPDSNLNNPNMNTNPFLNPDSYPPLPPCLAASHYDVMLLYNSLLTLQAELNIQRRDQEMMWQELAAIHSRITHEAELSKQAWSQSMQMFTKNFRDAAALNARLVL